MVFFQPGTYQTDGGGEFGYYWARLSDTSGEFEGIIANGNPQGPTTVTISPSDAAFETPRLAVCLAPTGTPSATYLREATSAATSPRPALRHHPCKERELHLPPKAPPPASAVAIP